MSPAPQRILFLRPDAYGDLFLFEPVPRLVRRAWPQAEIAVLIRRPYEDAVPLLASEGVRWLTTDCDPYRHGPGENPGALDALRETVRAFAPDCVAAACSEQTWLEGAVASFLPQARQVSLGQGLTDPLGRAALEAVLPVDWESIYPEKIPVEREKSEWEKNLSLASALIGHEAPRWWPVATVPPDARARASQILLEAGLRAGEFVVCAAAGTANVQIKSWPAEHYGESLAWLERERGIRALVIGHESERDRLEAVRTAARLAGAEPALWLGRGGEMPVVAGLLEAARFYFGNDTGALHLAAALGRPVVAIFGGGTWPRFQPVARRSLAVVQPLPCFGCAWDCYFVDAPCIRTVSPLSVRRALEQFLADDAEGQTIFEADGLHADARALIDTATPRLRFQREDSAARLRHSRELTSLLTASEADRAARQAQTEELTALLTASETDRDARRAQVEELTILLKASETDRDARGRQVAELLPLLQASETDRDARGQQVAGLIPLLRASDADRDARQAQIEELSALLKASETDRDARGQQVAELIPLLKASDADRDARQVQVEELTALLKASNADRDARGTQVAELTGWLLESEADRHARGELLAELAARLETKDADLASQGRHLAELTARLEPAPAELESSRVEDDPPPPAHSELADEPVASAETPRAMLSTDPAPSDEQELPVAPPLTESPASDTPLPVLPGADTRTFKRAKFFKRDKYS